MGYSVSRRNFWPLIGLTTTLGGSALFYGALIALLVMLQGCAVTAPLEPVQAPPARFRHNTIVPVQFVDQSVTGIACANRAKSAVLLASQACADTDLITMPNPCTVANGGWYARVFCHELAHANGWPPEHPDY